MTTPHQAHVHELPHKASCEVFAGDYACTCMDDARCPACVSREDEIAALRAEVNEQRMTIEGQADMEATLMVDNGDLWLERDALKADNARLRQRLELAEECSRHLGRILSLDVSIGGHLRADAIVAYHAFTAAKETKPWGAD